MADNALRASTLRASGLRVLAAALSAAFMAGCINFEGIEPQSKRNDPASLAASHSLSNTRLSPAAWPGRAWWRALGDPQLDTLIEEALKDSPTLQIARTRVEIVAATAAIADSRLGITSTVGANVTRQRASARGASSSNLAGREITVHHLSFDFSHELDFWDRNRHALDAELGRLKAAEADVHAARLALSATVARVYVQLALQFDLLGIEKTSLAQHETMLSLARARLASGLDTAIDAKRSEAKIPAARARILRVEEAITLTRHQLAALLGKGPDRGLTIQAPRLQNLADAMLPSALPADLVGRRADVIASRWRVEAAQKDIDAAKADFYPNINLAAYVGLQSLGLATLLSSGSHLYGFGPAVRLPLFGSTRLKGTLAIRDADYDANVERYNALIVEALHEVVGEVTALRSIDAQRGENELGLAAADEAYRMTLARYRSGLINRLALLAAEMQLLEYRTQLAALRARRFNASIKLVQALGGGFDETDLAQATPVIQKKQQKGEGQ